MYEKLQKIIFIVILFHIVHFIIEVSVGLYVLVGLKRVNDMYYTNQTMFLRAQR